MTATLPGVRVLLGDGPDRRLAVAGNASRSCATAALPRGCAPRERLPAAPDDRAAPIAPSVWTATGLERQVFLDSTGRRGRRVRLAGGGMGLLSAAWVAALVTGSIGFSNLPSLPPTLASLARRPPARVVPGAPARHPRSRRRLIELAALTPASAASAAAAHALARNETSEAATAIGQ